MSDAPPRGREAAVRQPDAAGDQADGDAVAAAEAPGDKPKSLRVPVGTRRTDNEAALLVEAELVASGKHLGNPARPASEATAERAIGMIEKAGLVPAWRVGGDPDAV